MGNKCTTIQKYPTEQRFSHELFQALPIELQEEIIKRLTLTDIFNCYEAGMREILFSKYNFIISNIFFRICKDFNINPAKIVMIEHSKKPYKVKSIGLTLYKWYRNKCFTCLINEGSLHPIYGFYTCSRCNQIDPRLRLIPMKEINIMYPKFNIKTLIYDYNLPYFTENSEDWYLRLDIRRLEKHINKKKIKPPSPRYRSRLLSKEKCNVMLWQFIERLPFMVDYTIDLEPKYNNTR